MNFLYGALYIGAAWKWGDWKHWRRHYPTILFFIAGDLLYHYLLYDFHPVWKFEPLPSDANHGITGTHISLMIMAVKYPCTVLIYLGNFPATQKLHQLLYIVLWTAIYGLNELLSLSFGGVEHYNGWNWYWSLLFNFVMFSILRIHHGSPPWAWLLSAIFIFFLWQTFDIPQKVFR